MEQTKLQEIRLKWGERPCLHQELADETHQGLKTGNRVCMACGREIYSSGGETISQ